MQKTIIKALTNDTYDEYFKNFNDFANFEMLKGIKIPRDEVKKFITDADILLLSSESAMPFDKEMIDAAPNVRFISLDTTDSSWVDVEYAESKGIKVKNNPHISTEAVAEHTIAFMLNLAKKIHQAYKDLYVHDQKMVLRTGSELKGKTLGVIGLGQIGTRVAELGNAFGMNVVAWNRSEKKLAGVKQVELDTLLTESDFISIHLTYNEHTKNFLSRENVQKMKKGVFFVNLAEKELVDIDALAERIESGDVAGYGIEFWEIEERNEHPIYAHDNVIAFNGFGWHTKEALDRTFIGWIGNVKDFLSA